MQPSSAALLLQPPIQTWIATLAMGLSTDRASCSRSDLGRAAINTQRRGLLCCRTLLAKLSGRAGSACMQCNADDSDSVWRGVIRTGIVSAQAARPSSLALGAMHGILSIQPARPASNYAHCALVCRCPAPRAYVMSCTACLQYNPTRCHVHQTSQDVKDETGGLMDTVARYDSDIKHENPTCCSCN